MTRECRGHVSRRLTFRSRYGNALSMHSANDRSCAASLVPAQEAQHTALRLVHALLGAHAITADGTSCASLDIQAQPPSCECRLAHMPLAALSQAVRSSEPKAHYDNVPSISRFDATKQRRMVQDTVQRCGGCPWSPDSSSNPYVAFGSSVKKQKKKMSMYANDI